MFINAFGSAKLVGKPSPANRVSVQVNDRIFRDVPIERARVVVGLNQLYDAKFFLDRIYGKPQLQYWADGDRDIPPNFSAILSFPILKGISPKDIKVKVEKADKSALREANRLITSDLFPIFKEKNQRTYLLNVLSVDIGKSILDEIQKRTGAETPPVIIKDLELARRLTGQWMPGFEEAIALASKNFDVYPLSLAINSIIKEIQLGIVTNSVRIAPE